MFYCAKVQIVCEVVEKKGLDSVERTQPHTDINIVNNKLILLHP